jgi:hypothetical protein
VESPSPPLEPGEMPTTFVDDVAPAELAPENLVPHGADVTGDWLAFTDEGVLMLVAWVEPGSDFARLPRGFAVWRHHDSSPPWRLALVARHDATDGIQDIHLSTTDVTGDGSDDALVHEGLGGSGMCARWLVIDLARHQETYRRRVCDGRIDPAPTGPPGLLLIESVYRPGDSHCCPSARRATTLRWTGAEWRVTHRSVLEA